MYSFRFVDSKGSELSKLEREQLAEYMKENGLVEINNENCRLNLKSEHICESGWTEHLKLKKGGKLEKYTMKVLKKLKNGESVTNTKSESKEVSELLPKLKNLNILKFTSINEYTILEDKRTAISKLIEFESWHKFLDWYDGQNTVKNISYNFLGSTIGQVNQSSGKMELNSSITQEIANKTAKEPKKKSWIEILTWIIGIIAGLAAIYEFIIKILFLN